PHLGAVHAELPRQPAELRDLIERRERAVLVSGEDVHEVRVARVETAQVVVPLEVLVVLAGIPVTAAGHAVEERPVMQHGKVETAAVPGHELWRVLLDAVEE